MAFTNSLSTAVIVAITASKKVYHMLLKTVVKCPSCHPRKYSIFLYIASCDYLDFLLTEKSLKTVLSKSIRSIAIC